MELTIMSGLSQITIFFIRANHFKRIQFGWSIKWSIMWNRKSIHVYSCITVPLLLLLVVIQTFNLRLIILADPLYIFMIILPLFRIVPLTEFQTVLGQMQQTDWATIYMYLLTISRASRPFLRCLATVWQGLITLQIQGRWFFIEIMSRSVS